MAKLIEVDGQQIWRGSRQEAVEVIAMLARDLEDRELEAIELPLGIDDE